MADAATQLSTPTEFPSSSQSFELLAAKNATLRLRAPSGHVYSFTDLTSADGLVNFGHLNPAIEPLAELASDVAPGFYPPAAASYAAWLCAKLGLTEHTVLFRVGKEAAVAAAIALAQKHRPGKILAIDGSIHIPGESGLESAVQSDRESVLRIQPGAEFTAWNQVSCVLYEPIQTAAGYVPLPLPWLRGLSQNAQAAGVLVIADETEAGFFRFGKLSLAASEFLRPDLFLFGNSMTNGVYPAFAVVHPISLEPHGNSSAFPTAAIGFAAAEAVARYIDAAAIEPDFGINAGLGFAAVAEPAISARIAGINSLLSQAGERLAANPALTAFNLAGPTLSLEVRNSRAAELAAACKANGILVGIGSTGRRIRIAPPITIPTDQLKTALKVIEKVAAPL